MHQHLETILDDPLYYVLALVLFSLNSFGLGLVLGLLVCM